MADKEKKILKFSSIKGRLEEILEERKNELGIAEPIVLVDGFMNPNVNTELTQSLIIGGTTLPTIIAIGKKSGRIYHFALKALINVGGWRDELEK